MEQQSDPWIRRVGGCVVYGFVLLLGVFLFFFGIAVPLKGHHPSKDVINKAVLGGPICFYFGVWG